jgi:hypothetical protein
MAGGSTVETEPGTRNPPETCSGSEAGLYLRLRDFAYHSTLGLRAIKSNKNQVSSSGFRASKFWFRITRVSGFGLRDPGFGIQDSGFGFRDSGFEIRDSGFGYPISHHEFRVSGFGIRDSGTVYPVSGFRIWDLSFGIRDSGFGTRDSSFGIGDPGFRIRDSGFGHRAGKRIKEDLLLFQIALDAEHLHSEQKGSDLNDLKAYHLKAKDIIWPCLS